MVSKSIDGGTAEIVLGVLCVIVVAIAIILVTDWWNTRPRR